MMFLIFTFGIAMMCVSKLVLLSAPSGKMVSLAAPNGSTPLQNQVTLIGHHMFWLGLGMIAAVLLMIILGGVA